MSRDIFANNSVGKKFSKGVKQRESLIDLNFTFAGYNEDIIKMYNWHINFTYYTGKGYVPLKLEDHHYFSENSSFGQSIRQVKGGSIRAFQENLQQVIQLIKVHLIPLLKELKQSDFYKEWFDRIVEYDRLYQEELKKGKSADSEKLKKYKFERDEAINHIKVKWANEVDGGRIWQINKSSTEQGLDFSLLPQLFFGTGLKNPLYGLHNEGKSISDQLQEDIYSVDISLGAKEEVARFMFRFYNWLPTAIKDTEVTFKLKLMTLKQIYSQLQMYIDFMKPLLIEINRKSEGFEKENYYRDFEMENPEFVNLFDYSYSYIKILGIRWKYDGYKIDDLEFTDKGLFLRGGGNPEIISGEFKGKSGYLLGEEDGKYKFVECEKEIADDEFSKREVVYLNKEDLRTFPVMEFNFTQKRRNEIVQSQQGPQQLPHMTNKINYKGFVWNLFEIATYRQEIKLDGLDLLESFVDELRVIKEDLIHYTSYLDSQGRMKNSFFDKGKSSDEEKKEEDSKDNGESLILGPFKAFGELFSPLLPSFRFKKFDMMKAKEAVDSSRDYKYMLNRYSIVEDVWKLYTINKKSHRFMQY